MYQRILQKTLQNHLFLGKAVIVYGPRQVGKTTLLKSLLTLYPDKKVAYLSCDEPQHRQALSNKGSADLRAFIGVVDVVVFDEAQLVENIGITIKLLVDNYPELQVIATGSSSFDLANKIAEPLTGRAFEFSLYSLSLSEIEHTDGNLSLSSHIDRYLITGLYPAIVSDPTRATETIRTLSGGFLYKDILAYEGVRKPELLEKILTIIARSQGNELSVQSIANDCDASQQTTGTYIKLLEQAHLLYTLSSLEKNDITSMRKKKKYYITDTGIRNTFVNGFGSEVSRNDIGQLWETLCVMERIKFHTNNITSCGCCKKSFSIICPFHFHNNSRKCTCYNSNCRCMT